MAPLLKPAGNTPSSLCPKPRLYKISASECRWLLQSMANIHAYHIINSWEVRWHRLSLTIRVALAAMYCTVRRTINIIQNEDFGLPSSEEFDQAAQYPPGHSVPTCQRGEARLLIYQHSDQQSFTYGMVGNEAPRRILRRHTPG